MKSKDNLREGIWVSAFLLWVRRLNEEGLRLRFVKGQPRSLQDTRVIPAEGELEEAAECEAHPRAAGQRDKSLGVPHASTCEQRHAQ